MAARDSSVQDARAVGIVRGGYPERFGTPRQPGQVPAARADVVLLPPYDVPESLTGLDGFSHVWLLYRVHANPGAQWTPTVRPPRLGGNRRVGVFASRSPVRPNPIGLSVVTLDAVHAGPDWCGLRISNHDLVEGTPVLDIKPYLPYSDCLPAAVAPAPFDRPPERLQVEFAPGLAESEPVGDPQWRALAEQTLAPDPRPAYRRGEDSGRVHGVRIGSWNVRFCVSGATVRVIAVERAT